MPARDSLGYNAAALAKEKMMIHRVQPWIVRGSRHVLRDRWISVRADDCVTVEGVEISPFYVLEYPDSVNIVALDGEHVLLVRQYRHALGRISLELPCGGVDAKDSDPVAAAARELLEETGYGNAERMTLIASLAPSAAHQNSFSHTVLAENVAVVQPPQHDGTEVLELQRVPHHEALRMALDGTIVQAAHVASLILGLRAAGKIELCLRGPQSHN